MDPGHLAGLDNRPPATSRLRGSGPEKSFGITSGLVWPYPVHMGFVSVSGDTVLPGCEVLFQIEYSNAVCTCSIFKLNTQILCGGVKRVRRGGKDGRVPPALATPPTSKGCGATYGCPAHVSELATALWEEKGLE